MLLELSIPEMEPKYPPHFMPLTLIIYSKNSGHSVLTQTPSYAVPWSFFPASTASLQKLKI